MTTAEIEKARAETIAAFDLGAAQKPTPENVVAMKALVASAQALDAMCGQSGRGPRRAARRGSVPREPKFLPAVKWYLAATAPEQTSDADAASSSP